MRKFIFKFCTLSLLIFSTFTSQAQLTSKKEAVNIFKDLMRIEPINCVVTKLNGKETILVLANKTGVAGNNKMFYSNPDIFFYKLSRFAGAWWVEAQKPIINEEFYYCNLYKDFDKITLSNKPYLYLMYKLTPMGNAVPDGTLSFALFSLSDFQLTTLDYDLNEKDFTNINDLNSKQSLLNFLELKASKSPLVYRASENDLDLNASANYEKKWQVDNSSIKSVWEVKEKTAEGTLRTTYYNQNLFPKDPIGSIENSQYKVVALFRNNILGFDKLKKKYFPIWVESCMHGCNKNISFLSPVKLKIVYSEANNQTITVDLSNMNYTMRLK
jgi:hypothetical protein